ADHRAAEVDEIAIAVGPGADRRVCEDDGVRFAPGDLLAERRPEQGLIGRAGEGRYAAELFMRLHQAAARRLLRAVEPDQFGMDQIERADIERRRNAHAAALRGEPLDEVEAGLAMIETAVDMGSA